VGTSKKNWELDGRSRSDPEKPLTYQPFLKWEPRIQNDEFGVRSSEQKIAQVWNADTPNSKLMTPNH
jgi:hypothetical protein